MNDSNEAPRGSVLLSQLTWPVHRNYRIEHGALLAIGSEARRYDPLAEQAAVGEVAKLHDGDERRLLRFARTWGPLGWPLAGKDLEPPMKGEPLSWIWDHARNVRLALQLYDYLQGEDITGLRQFFESYRARFIPGFVPGVEQPTVPIAGRLGVTERYPIADGREPERMAEDIIAAILNHNLAEVSYRVGTSPLNLRLHSPSLLGAVYWHLAGAVTRRLRLGRCNDPTCDSLFVTADSRQKYCPPPSWSRQTTGSLCGARDRKRRLKRKNGG